MRLRSNLTLLRLLPILACAAASPTFAAGCAQHDASTTSGGNAPASSAMGAPNANAQAPSPAASTTGKSGEEDWETESAPREKFEGGAKAFAHVKDALLKGYFSGASPASSAAAAADANALTEDDLYRAAVRGMLEHVDPKMRKWNKLLSPSDLAEMRRDLKGELVGVGVQIKFDQDTGYTDVLGLVPGSPAEKAGIVAGDLIVSVNGKLYKGSALMDVVRDIRGKAGEKVTLTVLRGDKLVSITVTREVLSYDAVSSFITSDGIGYVRIRGFNEKTVPMLKGALTDLGNKGAKALVLDLRDNQGGLFDAAVSSADLLLPQGTGIVTLKKRGQKDETFAAKGSPLLSTLPMAVLVDGQTSSGAELLTAALQEGRHATVVGVRTFGKWTLQSVDDELGNGYAAKYTIGVFQSPSGRSFQGVGLTPDVEVTMDEKAAHKAMEITDPEKRLAADAQLRTAATMIRGRVQQPQQQPRNGGQP
jgi:carboxyl-terminal processing protease